MKLALKVCYAVQQQEKIIKWLGTQTEDEHYDLCKQRDSSSAEWILKREEFNKWLSCLGSALLCLNGTRKCLYLGATNANHSPRGLGKVGYHVSFCTIYSS
jgi:hypothetical protein